MAHVPQATERQTLALNPGPGAYQYHVRFVARLLTSQDAQLRTTRLTCRHIDVHELLNHGPYRQAYVTGLEQVAEHTFCPCLYDHRNLYICSNRFALIPSHPSLFTDHESRSRSTTSYRAHTLHHRPLRSQISPCPLPCEHCLSRSRCPPSIRSPSFVQPCNPRQVSSNTVTLS